MLINNDIILFHGTNILFHQIKLNKSKNKLSIHTEKAISELEFLGKDEYDAEIFI